MAVASELDVMRSIDGALSGVSDAQARDRILRWAWAKFSPSPSSLPHDQEQAQAKTTAKRKTQKKNAKCSAKSKASHTILKELNLKPSGERSFEDFVNEKQPSSNQEKCVVAAYYVANILKETTVSSDHVYTCFKLRGWRAPADLDNTLQYVASQRGWLDTSDMSDIKLTVHGENLIEHDLPRANKEPKQ